MTRLMLGLYLVIGFAVKNYDKEQKANNIPKIYQFKLHCISNT